MTLFHYHLYHGLKIKKRDGRVLIDILTRILSTRIFTHASPRQQDYCEKPECHKEKSKQDKYDQKPYCIWGILFRCYRVANYIIVQYIIVTQYYNRLPNTIGGLVPNWLKAEMRTSRQVAPSSADSSYAVELAGKISNCTHPTSKNREYYQPAQETANSTHQICCTLQL